MIGATREDLGEHAPAQLDASLLDLHEVSLHVCGLPADIARHADHGTLVRHLAAWTLVSADEPSCAPGPTARRRPLQSRMGEGIQRISSTRPDALTSSPAGSTNP